MLNVVGIEDWYRLFCLAPLGLAGPLQGSRVTRWRGEVSTP